MGAHLGGNLNLPKVEATFPIDLAEGATVHLAIRFMSTAAGTHNATLTLQTLNMGPSPVALTGVATAR